MSTFSRDNGPGCCGPGDAVIYEKLRREIEQLRDGLTSLANQLGNYPGQDIDHPISNSTNSKYKLYADKIAVNTIEILDKLLFNGTLALNGLIVQTLDASMSVKTPLLDTTSLGSKGSVITGEGSFAGGVDIGGALTVRGAIDAGSNTTSTFSKIIAAQANITKLIVENESELRQGVTVTGATLLNGNLDVPIGSTTLHDLAVNMKGTLGQLKVLGKSEHDNGIDVNGSLNVTGKSVNSIEGDLTLVDKLIVRGATELATLSVAVSGLYHGTQVFNAGIQSNSMKTVDTPTPHNIIEKASNTAIVVGSPEYKLYFNVGNTEHPIVGNPDDPLDYIAYLSDIANAILFEGVVDYRAKDTNERETTYALGAVLPTSATTNYVVKNGDTCIVVDDAQTYKVTLWKMENGSWVPDVPPEVRVDESQADHAYQWHLNYHPTITDPPDTHLVYHEAELIWSPHSAKPVKVSIIETQLVNYYTKPEIDDLSARLYDLTTRQADWLVNERTTQDRNGQGVDNPAYIRNKPITGMSVLDGGNFKLYPDKSDYPQYIVDGGNFNVLGTNRGEFLTEANLPTSGTGFAINDYAYVTQDLYGSGAKARFKIDVLLPDGTVHWERDISVCDLKNLRQDVLLKLCTGKRVDIPAGKDETQFTLLWANDTNELFIDLHNVADDGTQVHGTHKRLNIPNLRTMVEQTLALGAEEAVWDATKKRSIDKSIEYSNPKTWDLLKSNDVEKYKIVSADSRIVFTDTVVSGVRVFSMTMRIEDLLSMITNSVSSVVADVGKIQPSDTKNTLDITWHTLTYQSISNATPVDTPATIRMSAGNGLALSDPSTVGTVKLTIISLDQDTINALDTKQLLRDASVAADNNDGISIRVDSNSLRVEGTGSHKSIELKPAEGIAFNTSASTADDKKTTLGLDTNTLDSLNTKVIKNAVPTVAAGSTKIEFSKNKSYKITDADEVSSLTLKVGSNVTIVDSTDPASPNDKIATIDIGGGNDTTIIKSVVVDDKTVTFKSNNIYHPDASDTETALEFATGTGIETSSLTLNGKTTLTTKLTDDVANTPVVKNVVFDTTDDNLQLTFPMAKVGDTTETSKVMKIVAGDGIEFANTGTADAPVLEISTGPLPTASSYQTLTLQNGANHAILYLKWVRVGILVSLYFDIRNSLGAESDTFTTQIPQEIRPAIDIQLGANMNNIFRIKTDGYIDYQIDAASLYSTTIMYFGGV